MTDSIGNSFRAYAPTEHSVPLSIVTTVYKSARFIEEFYNRCVSAATQITSRFEIVFVNDGSPDDSLDRLIQLHLRDPRVVVIDLSRNFGHHRAMMAGMQHARGDLVFTIDVDLEEDPADLPRFYERLVAENCDSVYGIQKRRRGSPVDQIFGRMFYYLVRQLGDLKIPANLTTMRLMTRRFVDSLTAHRERVMILSDLWLLTGYKQVAEFVIKQERTHKSNYSIAVRFRLVVDHVTSFSSDLLYKVFYAGIFVFVLSFGAMSYFTIRYLVTGAALAGWTSLAASVWMFGGLQTLLTGLIGIYVGHIFRETKNRPYVIVRDFYRREAKADDTELEEVLDGNQLLRSY